MTRALIPYFNASAQGQGLEGFLNWGNITMEYFLVPAFLFVLNMLAIYLATKNEYKMGGQIILFGILFGFVGMIAQTFTSFNQLILFVFAIEIIVGAVLSYVENSK